MPAADFDSRRIEQVSYIQIQSQWQVLVRYAGGVYAMGTFPTYQDAHYATSLSVLENALNSLDKRLVRLKRETRE
ncbi:MAG TPA: hypothetical protein VH540_24785 [Ktedonobacterales bacterium]|jgi:hypothetical protein